MPGKIDGPRAKWKQPEGGFKDFRIGELYDVVSLKKKKFNKRTDTSTVRNEICSLPLVNAKHGDNGIMFYGKPSVFESETMTIDIVQNGAVATGDVYPQPFRTGVLWDAYLIKAIQWQDTEASLLYMAAAIQKTIKLKFSYEKKATWERVKEESIFLPTKKNGKIDFDYIESRIRELEESRIRELEAYLIAAGFEDCVLTQSECDALRRIQKHTISLKEYKIGDIFDDATGRDIIIRDTKEGTVPLISHQHDNNGISRYIAPIEGRRIFSYKDTLSLADRGVFLATTQNHNFHIGTRVKALTFKDGEKSESVRLFFVVAINKLQIMFSEYLTNATDSLPSLNIMLPVADDGTIDFEFMDTYISAIKKQCIAALKQEISHEHQAYEQVIGNNLAENKIEEEVSKIIVLPDYREGCVPLYTLRAACGKFSGEGLWEEEGWIDASGNGFTPNPKSHFAVRAKGNSMYPKIKDSDICIFEWYNQVGGTREGDIVLAECNGIDDEATIKKYHSVKKQCEDGSWEHEKIQLIPLNKDYDVIELDSEYRYRTIGIFKCVLYS